MLGNKYVNGINEAISDDDAESIRNLRTYARDLEIQ